MKAIKICLAIIISFNVNAAITQESLSKLGEMNNFWVDEGSLGIFDLTENSFNKLVKNVLTGNANAQFSMAMYSQSLGAYNRAPLTAQEKETLTFELYKASALQQVGLAQKQMSFYYETGFLGLVDRDQDTSDMWLILAAQNEVVFFDETRIEKAKQNNIAVAMAERCLKSKYTKCE